MKHKLFVALSAAVFNLAVAITIRAHCGSTWITKAPSLDRNLVQMVVPDEIKPPPRLPNQFLQQYISRSEK